MMKKLLPLLVFILIAATASGDQVIKRGAAIPSDTKAVPIAEVIARPADFAKNPVVVEGVIAKACTDKGCWMELAPAAGMPGVRVTFKDYAFFVPLDCKGMNAKAEGVATVKTLSKKEADHLEGEGAKLARNADGTANEVSFVANGVELRK
jgi:hypothetical protein